MLSIAETCLFRRLQYALSGIAVGMAFEARSGLTYHGPSHILNFEKREHLLVRARGSLPGRRLFF
jgi:hypothetical protein